MSYNHAVRITLPFVDCSGIISQWAERCSDVVVYQHEADEEISKTHIHLGLYGCEVKAEQLKRMWVDPPGKGNSFWSWKEAEPLPTVWVHDTTLKYLTYMSKGTLGCAYFCLTLIPKEVLERSRQAWVEPVKADKPGDHSEKIIRKIVDYFDIRTDVGYYKGDDYLVLGQPKYDLELLLMNVRSRAFKVLWGEKRIAPHASHYKIIATTAFLRICEDAKCFDQGVAVIQKLWY